MQSKIFVLSAILALSVMVATSMSIAGVMAQTSTDSQTTTTTVKTPEPPKIKLNDNKVTAKPTTEKKTVEPTTTSKTKVKHPVPVKHIKKHKILKGSADYQKRYKMGWNMSCSDDMKETMLHKTMPHTKAFLDGYKDARIGDGPCPF